jgi:hypothetical protein
MSNKNFTVKDAAGNDLELVFKDPEIEDIEESDSVYASKVAALVRDSGRNKLLLRTEIDRFLRDNGVWSKSDEDAVAKCQKKIEKCIEKLKRGGIRLSEGREYVIQITDARKEIMRIMNKRQVFDDTTIEALAENDKNDYLVFACTTYKDGNRYWESFEDMKNDKLGGVYRKASMVGMHIVYGVDENFEKNLPENKWLKKYKFVDDELNYLDRKTGKRVDQSGRPIEQVEAEVMKKLESISGEIVAEKPFIDDETGSPVVEEAKPKEEPTKDAVVEPVATAT